MRINRPTIVALVAACALTLGCQALNEIRSAQDHLQGTLTELEVVSRENGQTARELQARYASGEITFAEYDAQVAALRAEILASLETSKESFASLTDAFKGLSPEAIAAALAGSATDVAPMLPGPWNYILSALGIVGAGFYGQRAAKKQTEQLNEQRNLARIMRGEAVETPAFPRRATPSSVVAPPPA